MLDDRVHAAPLLGAGKMQRKLERRAHQRDAEDADECRGPGKCRRRQGKPRALLSQQIVARRRDILQAELRYEMSPRTDRVNRTFENKTRYRSFYRNVTQDAARRGTRIGADATH